MSASSPSAARMPSSSSLPTQPPLSRRTSSHRRSSSRDGYGPSDGRQRRSRISTSSTSSSSSLSNEWRAHEEQQAARMIQRAVRAHLSRRRFARLVRRVYDKQFDPVTQRVFYVNLLTNESSWDPPALLVRFEQKRGDYDDDIGDEDDELVKGIPKRGAQQILSKRDAAVRIQRLARAFVARKRIRTMVRELYMKLFNRRRARSTTSTRAQALRRRRSRPFSAAAKGIPPPTPRRR